jgi:ankyrin repeat protein
MRGAILLAGVLLVAPMPILAADLEPARDAVRRHQYELAVELLRSPAAAGDPEAGFMLAQLQRSGRGVSQNLPEACRLLEQAALAGFIRAAASLASMLDGGDCGASARTAEQWRELATAGGHAPPPVKPGAQVHSDTASQETLLRAARVGDLAGVRSLLLQLPADVTDEYGRTPLMLAAEAGSSDTVRELLEHGAEVARSDRNGDTALLLAVRAESAVAVDLLIAAGAPVDAANRSGVTPLMVAARAGSDHLVRRLVAAGADPGQRDAAGLTAGDFAARAGHTELGSRLGVAAPRAPSGPVATGGLYAGRSLLMIAAERGDIEAIHARVAAGDDVGAKDLQGMSALAIAAAAGKAEAVERLLGAGAAIDATDAQGWTALGHALRSGQAAAALPLIHGGADVRKPQGTGKTPLLLVVESRQAGLIAPLVNAGADIDAADASGTTPLVAAGAAGDDGCVKALLEAGARSDLTDKRGRTALWLAANQGAVQAVRRLAAKSPLDTPDAEGTTPIAAGAARGSDDVVKALLVAGANARIVSLAGNTALHVAAAAGRAGTVALLTGKAGDVDAVNQHQDTALILAVKARCTECARTLLAAGASTRLRNSDGLTAADVARLTGNDGLVKVFD